MKFIYLLSAFMFLATMSFTSCKRDKTSQSSQGEPMEMPTEYQETFQGDEYPSQEQLSEDPTTVMVEDSKGDLMPEPVQEATSTNANQGNFYIVAGSFTVKSNATQLVKKLVANGENSAQILEPYGAYNRVAVRSFSSREEAKQMLPTLKNKLKDQTLWILKR